MFLSSVGCCSSLLLQYRLYVYKEQFFKSGREKYQSGRCLWVVPSVAVSIFHERFRPCSWPSSGGLFRVVSTKFQPKVRGFSQIGLFIPWPFYPRVHWGPRAPWVICLCAMNHGIWFPWYNDGLLGIIVWCLVMTYDLRFCAHSGFCSIVSMLFNGNDSEYACGSKNKNNLWAEAHRLSSMCLISL